MRSPDGAWVKRERPTKLIVEQKEKFLPLCPEFMIELRSSSDHLPPIEEKMHDYIENGARLGWLRDPEERKVHVYRPDDEKPKVLENPDRLSGDPVWPGFVLDLKTIWEPGF